MEKRTEISAYGQFGLVERLTQGFAPGSRTTVAGIGDDAAAVSCGRDNILVTTDLLLEGVHFDLTYFPMKHLGYKAVVVAVSDILAMNGLPHQLTVALGISAKLSVEMLEDFYEGLRAGCAEYGLDLVGGDTSPSLTGFSICVTALGRAPKKSTVYRSGTRLHDLVCLTGDLGAAYMGLKLLEREKHALEGHPDPQPRFGGYEYPLRRQLRPAARIDVVRELADAGIVPTSMIDLSDGLASDMLQICKSSRVGARIYLDRLPIAAQTGALAAEMNADPVTAALNGGEDYELLFTVPLADREKIGSVGGIEIIGHITEPASGAVLVAPDGSEIALSAPGFTGKTQKED